MWPAVVSAAVRPIFIAIRTSTMKPWRRVCVTMTGASAMATSSEARDLDARVLELVAAVDRRPGRPDPLPEPPRPGGPRREGAQAPPAAHPRRRRLPPPGGSAPRAGRLQH